MAGQPRQSAPAQGAGALTLWEPQTGLMAQAAGEVVRRQVEAALAGNTKGLTFDRIALDLCAYMNANPAVGVKANEQGVMMCLINAGRYQTTFGDGGLWVIPDEKNTGGVRTQESRKFQVDRSRELKGVDEYRARRVYKVDQPVTTTTDDLGEITSFTLAGSDITEERALPDLMGVFVTATFTDDRTPRVFWWAKIPDLNHMRDHSPSMKGSGMSMWRDDPEQAYELAAIAASARKILPVRTMVSGMPGDVALGEPIVIDAEDVTTHRDEPTSSEAAADELLARGAEAEAEAAPAAAPEPSTVAPELPPLPDPLQQWVDRPEDSVVKRAIMKIRETAQGLGEKPRAFQVMFGDCEKAWLDEMRESPHAASEGQGYGVLKRWLKDWGDAVGVQVLP